MKLKLFGLISILVFLSQIAVSASAYSRIHTITDHIALMKATNVYYPWKPLIKDRVFTGQEEISSTICAKSVWLCIWQDSVNKDVACIMTITSRPDGKYSIEVARDDGGNAALELCVEIKGVQWYPFKQGPTEENIGYAVTLWEG